MVYIATFFTHYGAMSFHREQKRQGLAAQMMPVPRALSASCGVCVRVEQPEPHWATKKDCIYRCNLFNLREKNPSIAPLPHRQES